VGQYKFTITITWAYLKFSNAKIGCLFSHHKTDSIHHVGLSCKGNQI